MARPLIRRQRLTSNISKTGTNRIKQGMTKLASGTRTLLAATTAAQAKKNPMGSDPKSPIKIFAGLKLNKRNPATETSNKTERAPIGEFNPDNNATPAKPIMATPPARPSILSMILNALEMTTIQSTVKTQLTPKLGVIGLITPEETVQAATRTSIRSFGLGPSPFISSMKPSRARTIVDSKRTQYWREAGDISALSQKINNTGPPPNCATVRLLQRFWDGTTTHPLTVAILIKRVVRLMEPTAAAKASQMGRNTPGLSTNPEMIGLNECSTSMQDTLLNRKTPLEPAVINRPRGIAKLLPDSLGIVLEIYHVSAGSEAEPRQKK